MPTIRDFWLALKAVLRTARQQVSAALEPLGLTGAEGDILFHLLTESDGLTQEQLAERLDVGKAPISRSVASLAAKGYLRRERHPNDARAYCVNVTGKAVEISGQIQNAYNGVYLRAKQGLPEAEFERLAALLGHVAENLHSTEVKR